MKIVMPIAGAGSRFQRSSSANFPKPLVLAAGHPLIEWATRNLAPKEQPEWVFIVRQEHLRDWPELEKRLLKVGEQVAIHALPLATPSPLHTLLAARHLWEGDALLLIANCDQFLANPIAPWIEAFAQSEAIVGVLTVESGEPHFVHVAVGESGVVTGIAGKRAVDLPAAAGYYLFRSGHVLASLIERSLGHANPHRESCVTDAVAEALATGLDVRSWNLGGLGEKYFPLGDPEYVTRYEPQLLKL